MNYYVYVYLDTRKPGNYIYDNLIFDYEPIYIGKGKNNRCKKHLSLRFNMENYFYHKLNKIIMEGFYPEILIIKDNMTEEESFKYEVEIIKKIGKLIDNNGTLTNLTDGGEGRSGSIVSLETRKKLSDIKTGIKMIYCNSEFHPMKGKSFDEYFGKERSQEIKKIIVKNAKPPWKDVKIPDDMKNKISKTLKEKFKNKENHPRYGKINDCNSNKKTSKSLKIYFEKNPKIVSDETKKLQSMAAKNRKYIIKIKNLETEEILTFNNTTELREYISKFKLERNIGKTSSPSYNLLINGKSDKYFILIDKYHFSL